MYEWPLIISTLSSSVLFALIFSAWNKAKIVSPPLYISVLLVTGLIFLYHYRKSSVLNHLKITLLVSPYGWAILIFATFAICSVVALLTGFELFWILSFLSGLLLLVAIDTAHAKSDKRNFIRYHNAQVFLTGLLLASYLVSEPLAFIFISAIKTMYILLFKLSREGRIFEKGYSLLYICYLAFISYSLFTSLPENHFAVFFTLLLIFELGMRIIFYFDLNPAERNKNIQ